LTRPADELEIVIPSEGLAPLVRKDENFFPASAYLQSRKSKQRTLPSHVCYERDEKGFGAAAVFLFPRKTESGVSTISPGRKTVEFICKIEGATPRLFSHSRKWSTKKAQRSRTPRRLAAIAASTQAVISFFLGKLSSSDKIRRVP
jgi:hypothetical protein